MAKKQYPDDDGRVIAPMNVEGMPWHNDREGDAPQREQTEPLTKAQTARVIWTATLTSLAIGLVFCAAIVLLVLFLLWLWK